MSTSKLLSLSLLVALTLSTLSPDLRAQKAPRHAVTEKTNATVVVLVGDAAAAETPGAVTGKVAPFVPHAASAPQEFVVKPGTTNDLNVVVIDGSGTPIPGSTITLDPEPGDFDGGHKHGASTRPAGSFTPTFVDLPTGRAAVKFNAPKVGGQVFVNGSCTAGNGGGCTWNPWIYNVRVSDLVELSGGGVSGSYELVGQKPTHPKNHFGTAGMVNALDRLASEYAAKFNGERLAYNDMSLEWGGVFDIRGDWAPPHGEHSEGKSTDLRSTAVKVANRAALLQFANKHGFGVLIHDGSVPGDAPHWHLRFGSGPECQIYKRRLCTPGDQQFPPGHPDDFDALQLAPLTLQVSVQVTQNPTTGLFTYSYTITNDAASALEANAFQLLVNRAVVLDVKTPAGWTSEMWRDGAAVAFAATATGPPPPGFVDNGQLLASPFQIKPGQSLSGFSFLSPDPPGSVEIIAQGFEQLAVLDPNSESVPGGTILNSFKGTVQGPVAAVGLANRIDDTSFFVRQNYDDFLGRDPDAAGFQFWAGGIEQCGASPQCRQVRRVNTSAAFYLAIEFQETSFLAYRMYKAAYGNIPGKPIPVRRDELMPDARLLGKDVAVGIGNWPQQLEANKVAYARAFVSTGRFAAAFPASMTAAQFVDRLNQNAGGALSAAERSQLIGQLTNPSDAPQRAAVLRKVAEDSDLARAETNRAFVLMQYFGYLLRNPDDVGFDGQPDPTFLGFNFWLQKLNQFNGDFNRAEMVRAFIESIEYRRRFGP